MNQIRSINLRRVIVVLAVLLLVSIVVIFWMREVVREVLVLPISYLLFVAGIFIDSTPQVFFWVSILLTTFWIAYRSMSSKRRKPPPLIRPVADNSSGRQPFSGRVSSWAAKVRQMRKYNSSYYRGTFHQSLARLLVELLAHRYRLTPLQAEERLRNGVLDVPAEVRAYFLSSMGRPEPIRIGFFARLRKMLNDTWRDWLNHRFEASPLEKKDKRSQTEAQIERIILYMEEELEVAHDHPSQ